MEFSTIFDNNNEVRRGKKWANEDKFIAGRITNEMRRSNDDNQSI